MWAHLTAIGGTGMGALAALLQELGWTVTGSDGPLYPPMSTFLAERKIPLREGYAPENLDGAAWKLKQAHPDLVVIGNAISRGNAEAQRCEELLAKGQTQRMSFAQALAEYVIGDKKSFVVAGTHGKSTTSSLLAWALESLGLNPSFFIGAIPGNFSQGCRATDGRVFAAEGDEYDTAYWDKESKFLHYRPTWVLCTGIEFDHADIYADLAAVERSFLKLVSKTKTGWLLVDAQSAPKPESVDKCARELAKAGLRCLRYGEGVQSDYRLLACEMGPQGSRLSVQLPGWKPLELLSPMAGKHNALNVLGVLGVLHASGELQTPEQAQAWLKTFRGLKRRQEEVFSSERLVVIDDFAHHPTAIRETIAAIRARYPGRKLAAFFEPRSATSARNVLQAEFTACFDEADAVFLQPPTKTNVPAEQKLDVQAMLGDMAARPALRGKELLLGASPAELAQLFRAWQQRAAKPAVALVMSNGAFGGLHGMLAKDAG